MSRSGLFKAADQNAVGVLLAGAALIAVSPLLVRVSEIGPVSTAFYRQLLGLPLIWLWLLYDRSGSSRFRQPENRRDYALLALAGLMFAGDLSLWHWSIHLTSIANSTMLVNFAPIFVAIGSFLLFGERFTARFLVGLACTMLGVILLLGDSSGLGRRNVLGDTLGLSAAVCYGGYLLIVGRLRSEFSTVTIMAWTTATSSIVLLAISIATGEPMLPASLNGWLILLGLALVTHVGGQGLVAWALAHLPASFGSVGLMMQPVLAALLAWWIFGESVSLAQFAGGAIILTGIYLARPVTRRGGSS